MSAKVLSSSTHWVPIAAYQLIMHHKCMLAACRHIAPEYYLQCCPPAACRYIWVSICVVSTAAYLLLIKKLQDSTGGWGIQPAPNQCCCRGAGFDNKDGMLLPLCQRRCCCHHFSSHCNLPRCVSTVVC